VIREKTTALKNHRQATPGSGARAAWWYGNRSEIEVVIECRTPGGGTVTGLAKISRQALAEWLDANNGKPGTFTWRGRARRDRGAR